MYYLGFDIGSSSIKASLVESETQKHVATVSYPETEMDIVSTHPGWAEQDPEDWWSKVRSATGKLLAKANIDSAGIAGIGLSYQMHGLVIVDRDQQVLRPSIIWCDSRAVAVGNQAFERIGKAKCLSHLLNSPGNFTASKLKWVKENEPRIYDRIHKIMLPGDFIAMKMTGEVATTVSGLSEGILWDFKNNRVADFLLDQLEIDPSLIPGIVPTFSEAGHLTSGAARFLGLPEGIPVAYRAGDQPNNALSLNVFEPGEVAATGGTSGVVFGVSDQLLFDNLSRINSFAHVNHTAERPRIGTLLCINGAGIQYRWMKQQMAGDSISYDEMESIAEQVPVNSDGLRILPFGNGAERIFENRDIGAQVVNLNFNRHHKPHFYRAALEGIAYSFVYGMEILRELGSEIKTMKAGNDNLFQSRIFSTTIASVLDCEIEMFRTTGATGAARAVGYSLGHYKTLGEALGTHNRVKTYSPESNTAPYKEGYQQWKKELENVLTKK